MARVLKCAVFLALLACVSLWALYLFVFAASDSYTPEEINDMFQNKDSDIRIKKVELRDQALRAPFLDKATYKSDTWNIEGNAVVKNAEYVRLTSELAHQASNMFAKMPVQAESFEMELTFHIHGKASHGLVGDGLAVWFLDKPSPIGSVFGAANEFNGLGIFVDTYRNGGTGHFPYILAMRGDGQTSYNKYKDGMDTKLAGCTAKSVLNPASGLTRMRIVRTKNGYLSVDLNYNPEESDVWHNCFTLSDVLLPPVKYLGFLAETGELFHNTDIIENKMYALYQPNSDDFLESLHQLEDLLEKQEGQMILSKKRTRKSLVRLKKAEERLKERERTLREEKYGDADATLVRRWAGRLLVAVKFAVLAVLAVLILWVVKIVYRTLTQKKRTRTTGLLDY